MKLRFSLIGALLVLGLAAMAPLPAAGAIRDLPGFAANAYGQNDDGTFPCTGLNSGVPTNSCTPVAVPIGFSVTFYGETFSELYLNNNGNVTFDDPLAEYTPFGLLGADMPIIGPFFADVDTRVGNLVTFGNDTVNGNPAFGVNWIDVGYFDENVDKLNSFQLILINRADRNPGDFDIEFNYDQVQWETGDASGGEDGLGGDSAVVGYSNGSGLPGTSFQLQGSAIPGELLDNNPGGLIHGYYNSTPCMASAAPVLGRYGFAIINSSNLTLNVTPFLQTGSAWAGETYAATAKTIAQKGCALSSLAMALDYAGAITIPGTGEAMNPGTLNTLLETYGDFTRGGNLDWFSATRDASSDQLVFHGFRTTDTQYLSQMLACGYPVIVGVNLTEGKPGHFVVVTGQSNGQFLINDPGHPARTTLAAYNNDFETRGYVGDPPGDVSGLHVCLDGVADVLVVDPLGRRVGYDPASGSILGEIPQSAHFSDCLEEDNQTEAPGTDTTDLVGIYQPGQGVYQVFIGATNPGSYQLVWRYFSPAGTPGSSVTLEGTATPAGIVGYQGLLTSAGVASQPFTSRYPWSASPTNGVLPLTVQFTAPSADSAGNPITSWYWSFGDGSIGTEQNPQYTYDSAGIFFPEVSALNSTGGTVVAFGPAVNIPTVQFTANPLSGAVPLTVQFSAASADSAGIGVTNWLWDFGDGFASTQQNPSHLYTNADTFFPTLVSTDNEGTVAYGSGPEITATNMAQYLGLVLNGGFETGDFTGWNLFGGDPDDNYVGAGDDSPLAPHTGDCVAVLGSYGSLSFLSQSLATVPGAAYHLSLWLDSPDGETPSEFAVYWNGATLFDQADIPAMGWTNLQFQVRATGTSCILQLGFQDDNSYLGLDDIGVYALVPPNLGGATVSGANLVLNGVNGVAGQPCLILMTTNLSLPVSQWSLIASNVLAASGSFTVTVTNAVSRPVRERFYILQP